MKKQQNNNTVWAITSAFLSPAVGSDASVDQNILSRPGSTSPVSEFSYSSSKNGSTLVSTLTAVIAPGSRKGCGFLNTCMAIVRGSGEGTGLLTATKDTIRHRPGVLTTPGPKHAVSVPDHITGRGKGGGGAHTHSALSETGTEMPRKKLTVTRNFSHKTMVRV